MISPTGNSGVNNSKGLTFIEIMVTVVILSLGLTMIYKAFFMCFDYLTHLTNRIYANNIINNKINSLQMEYQATGEIPAGKTQFDQELLRDTPVPFQYAVNLYPLGELKDIYELNIILSWQERGQTKNLVRTAYLSHP